MSDFAWVPEKYSTDVAWHMTSHHKDLDKPRSGWFYTTPDELAHTAAHEVGIAGTTPHKHWKPKRTR